MNLKWMGNTGFYIFGNTNLENKTPNYFISKMGLYRNSIAMTNHRQVWRSKERNC